MVELDNKQHQTFNDDIKASFDLTVSNNIDEIQNFEIILPNISGWDIKSNADKFVLTTNEMKEISISMNANNNFDYRAEVISSDTLKYSKDTEYRGTFDFPIIINGSGETLKVSFRVDVIPKSDLITYYEAEIVNQDLSPIEPLKYSIRAKDIFQEEFVDVKILFDDKEIHSFQEYFSEDVNYKVFERAISTDVAPKDYNVKILIRKEDSESKKVSEWYDEKELTVKKYVDLSENEKYDGGIFTSTYTVELKNNGNTKNSYEKIIETGTINSWFFNSNTEYTKDGNNIIIKTDLNIGESKTIVYGYNYFFAYLLIIIILIMAIYIYIRKTSNPLAVESKIYDITKVEHEGIKSLKVRIGFENIKEDMIDDLKIIFRMPSYLNIKDNSFLLVEPNSVLKGQNQFKLIWNFKKFEQGESRILGFTLVNKKGILGDIKLPNLEIEIGNKRKMRRYYESFPAIKG
jgi:hypothetical protein